MTTTAPRMIAACIAIAVVAGLYSHRLSDVPAYVGLDEAHFANHAYSLATTARDLNGNRLPLFVSLEDPLGDRPVLAWGTTWYHPFGFYLIASILTIAPLAEWSMRLPMVLIGLLNVILMYGVARRWFDDRRIGFGAAALLAMTPTHFILSRLALDYLLPLPFILAWLWCLISLMRHADRRLAFATGALLGVGCFSYVSSWLMMPIYLVISLAITLRSIGRRELLAPMVAGFATPMLVLAAWLLVHPSVPRNILAQYQAGETRRSVLHAVVTGTEVPMALRDAIAAYWSYFNPSLLFVTGGVSRMVSTGAIGVWPMGMAVLLAAGVIRVITRPATAEGAILIAGLLTAPLPAALKGEPFAIQRAIALLPFGVLLAAGGLASVLENRSRLARAIVVMAAISVPLQFSGFLGDYFGEYRTRSAAALDSTAFKETANILLGTNDAHPIPAIALTAPLYDVSAKWRFYCTKMGKTDLLERTRYFNGELATIADMESGSLAVVPTESLKVIEGWTLLTSPESVWGTRPLSIVRRQ